jgi:hypothetical protein
LGQGRAMDYVLAGIGIVVIVLLVLLLLRKGNEVPPSDPSSLLLLQKQVGSFDPPWTLSLVRTRSAWRPR